MAQKNYYATLGIKRSESQSGLRKAYRKLARKYHPDLNPGDKSAEERFKQIQEAYKVLSDPEKRKIYDHHGYYRDGQGTTGGQGFQDPGGFAGFDSGHSRGGGRQTGFRDIFSDLFGGRKSRTAARATRGQDLEVQASIPLMGVVEGMQVRINAARRIVCTRCKGTGTTSSTKQGSCPRCGGSGQSRQMHGAMNFSTPCPQCQGEGKVPVGDCSACGGGGFGQKVEILKVRIPPGVKSGSRIRVAGKGDAGGLGGPPGDLFLVVDVQSHPFFRREGNDLLCTVPVTITEAALGSDIEVPTIAGKARLKIPSGTQNGQKFRLRGQGVPSMRSGGNGDQLVEVNLVLPQIQDERSKEILREFAKLNPQDPRAKLGSDS